MAGLVDGEHRHHPVEFAGLRLGLLDRSVGLFHQRRIAAEIHMPALQPPPMLPQQSIFRHHLERRHGVRKEVGFPSPDDGNVEKITPGGATGQEPVEGITEHGDGVVPFRIGDEQDLLASLGQSCDQGDGCGGFAYAGLPGLRLKVS